MSSNKARKKAARRRLLGRFWKTALGFWRSGAGQTAWLLSGALLAIVLAQVYINYRIHVWNRSVFDALEKKDTAEDLAQALLYVPLVCSSVFLALTVVYARMTMQRRWREWLTYHALDRWLANRCYYHLNLIEGEH